MDIVGVILDFVQDIGECQCRLLIMTEKGDIELGYLTEKSIKMGPVDAVDGRRANKSEYASKKSVAEGMMDIALLTANANQLRFLIAYNTGSQTFYVSLGLLILSLVLQVSVGIALIFKVTY